MSIWLSRGVGTCGVTQARREGTCIQARQLSLVVTTATASTSALSRLPSLLGRNIAEVKFGQVRIGFDHEFPLVGPRRVSLTPEQRLLIKHSLYVFIKAALRGVSLLRIRQHTLDKTRKSGGTLTTPSPSEEEHANTPPQGRAHAGRPTMGNVLNRVGNLEAPR